MLNLTIVAIVLTCASLVVCIGAVVAAVEETSPFRVGVACLSALVLLLSGILAGELYKLAVGAGA